MDRDSIVHQLGVPGLARQLSRVDECLLTSASQSGSLKTSTAWLVKRSGKRLRPAVLLLASQTNGAKIGRPAITAAAAVECIHLASLAHDQLMDGHVEGMADAESLLVGDFLIASGLGMAASLGSKYSSILTSALAEMAGGQAGQLSRDFRYDPREELYIKINSQKTGALFEAAACLGAVVGGCGQSQTDALAAYGRSFGIFFQIVDDIIDGDFPAGQIPVVSQIAQKRSSQLTQSLNNLPQSSPKHALARLPGIYLQAAVP